MNWQPQDYARNSAAQLQWAQTLIERLNLTGSEQLLDVGCGDGKITAHLAQQLPQGSVMGVDVAAEMIAYAQATYPPTTQPNLRFACQDARSLSFETQFDLIFSNAVLHWVDDHWAFLQGAHRALKPGGKLILSCGGQGNAADIVATFTALVQEPAWQADFPLPLVLPYTFHSSTDYQPWLQALNFQVQRLALVPKDMTHQGINGLAGWIRTTWFPWVNLVPEPRQAEFVAQFCDRYLAQFPVDEQGLTHVRMVRLEVEAQK